MPVQAALRPAKNAGRSTISPASSSGANATSNSLNAVQPCGPANDPSAYVASMVARRSPWNCVGTAKSSVVPVAEASTGSSYPTTSIRHGTPRVNHAVSVACVPYPSPTSRSSRRVDSVSEDPETR